MGEVNPLISKSNPELESDFFEGVTPSEKRILVTINLVLQTAFLKSNPKPISLLLVGRPGLGKSRLLPPLSRLGFVSYVNDITPTYLVDFLEKVKRKEKRFLVIPDFTNCMSHGKSTRTTLVALLRSMTEEGVKDLSDYHLEFKADVPARAGLITAITASTHQDYARAWKSTGFLSRLLPFSFTHSTTTESSIRDSIDAKLPDLLEKVRFKVEHHPPSVICPTHLLRQLRAYQDILSKSTDSALSESFLLPASVRGKGHSSLKL